MHSAMLSGNALTQHTQRQLDKQNKWQSHVGYAGFWSKMVHNTALKEAEGPNTLKYYVNEQNVDEDEAQGENRQTPSTNRKTVWYES